MQANWKMRAVSTALALLFVLTMAAACSGGKSDSGSAPKEGTDAGETKPNAGAEGGTAVQESGKKEEYVIKFMTNFQPGVNRSDETKVGKLIKDKFNIVFEYVPYTGNMEEKLALMLAGNDYPEIVRLYSKNMFSKYLNAGALLPLDELVDKYGPNFKESHKNELPYWKMDAPDGKLYKYQLSVPSMQVVNSPGLDVMVRSDILEALGYPELTTTDDYLHFFEEAMKKFPDQKLTGLSFAGAEPWGLAGIGGVLYEKGKYTAVAGNRSVIWDGDSKKFVDYFLNPYVKENFQFFNKLYRMGALDPEAFTDLGQQVQDKANAGRPVAIWYMNWVANAANAEFRKQNKANMEYVMMPIMSPTMLKNNETRVQRIIDIDDWGTLAITKNAKHPERIMELLDWAATEEGKVMLGWGLEGDSYTKDADGKRVLTDSFIKKYLENPQIIADEGIATNGLDFLGLSYSSDAKGQNYSFDNDTQVLNLLMSDRLKEVYKHYGWEGVTDPWHKNKSFKTSTMHTGFVQVAGLDASSPENKIEEKLIDFRIKSEVALIMTKSDEEFDALWEKLVKEYKALGPEQVIDKYNDNYANLAAKFESLK